MIANPKTKSTPNPHLPKMILLQDCLREDLKVELNKIKDRNPNYSLRALARSLKMSSGTLSSFLSRKRVFSMSKIEAILMNTPLDLKKTRKTYSKVATSTPSANPTDIFDYYPSHDRVTIDKEQYSMLVDWYNFAILSLAETQDFQGDPAWIAQRLRIPLATAKQSLSRMQKLNLLIGEEPGKIKPSGQSFITTDNVPSELLKTSQHQNLELAKQSLYRDPVEERDFFAMTMAIDPSKIDEAKRRVRVFMDSLCDLMESGERREVYRAQMQIFPLSTRDDNLSTDTENQ
ncbi:MAG TPA: DUF4423 domain-containing protein [Bdellovibrionota bacterium]|jgi:uncharacterized protein (TIGR02147 family)|nr:DUF4423 domain-containing protein [Bdellovibrionota bacterium]